MSFRFFDPGAQLFTNDGKVLASGSIEFTDSGTTNPRTTWSDPGMTTPNPNPVPLDGAGRPNNDIWGDGVYRVTIRDALGATVGLPLDNVSGPVGIPDPALQSGEFLTNDGTDVFWQPIRQVPDPTGQADGNVLTTDGAGNTAWEASGLANVRQVPDPAGIDDGWVLTRDDASPGDYAWKAPPSNVGGSWSANLAGTSRVVGDVYTNTDATDRMILISAGGNNNGLRVDVNSVGIAITSWPNSSFTQFMSVVVPPGETYSVITTHGPAPNVFAWFEKQL